MKKSLLIIGLFSLMMVLTSFTSPNETGGNKTIGEFTTGGNKTVGEFTTGGNKTIGEFTYETGGNKTIGE